MTSALTLWLFVLDLGIVFGAGLYEHRIVLSRWLQSDDIRGKHWNAEAARADDTGRRFWGLISTGPLTLLTIANLVLAWDSFGPIRPWWLAAGVAAFADRALTFSYFIPTMIRLMRAPDSTQSVEVARRWANLNYLRLAIVLVAWLAALKAFGLFYHQTH